MKRVFLLLAVMALGGCVARVDSGFVRLRAEVVAPGSAPRVAAVYPQSVVATGSDDLATRFGPAWRPLDGHAGRDFN